MGGSVDCDSSARAFAPSPGTLFSKARSKTRLRARAAAARARRAGRGVAYPVPYCSRVQFVLSCTAVKGRLCRGLFKYFISCAPLKIGWRGRRVHREARQRSARWLLTFIHRCPRTCHCVHSASHAGKRLWRLGGHQGPEPSP